MNSNSANLIKANKVQHLNLITNSTTEEAKKLVKKVIVEFHEHAAQLVELGMDIPKEAQVLILHLKQSEDIDIIHLESLLNFHQEFSALISDKTNHSKKNVREQLLNAFYSLEKAIEKLELEVPNDILDDVFDLEQNTSILNEDLAIVAKHNRELSKVLNPDFQTLKDNLLEQLNIYVKDSELLGKEINKNIKNILTKITLNQVIFYDELELIEKNIQILKEQNKPEIEKLKIDLKQRIFDHAQASIVKGKKPSDQTLSFIESSEDNLSLTKLIEIDNEASVSNKHESVQIVEKLMLNLKYQVNKALENGKDIPGELIPLIKFAEDNDGDIDKSDYAKLFKYNKELKELNKSKHPKHVDKQIDILRDLINEASELSIELNPEKSIELKIDPLALLKACDENIESNPDPDTYENLLSCNKLLSKAISKQQPAQLDPMIENVKILLDHCLKEGKAIPVGLIETLRRIKFQKINQELVHELSNYFEELKQKIEPANLKAIKYLNDRKTFIAGKKYKLLHSRLPIRRHQLALFGFAIFWFIYCNFNPSIYVDLPNGIIGSFTDSTAQLKGEWNVLTFIFSAALIGSLMVSLSRLNRLFENFQYHPTQNFSIWMQVMLGILIGLAISEMSILIYFCDSDGCHGLLSHLKSTNHLKIIIGAIKLGVALLCGAIFTSDNFQNKIKSLTAKSTQKNNSETP